MPASMQWLTFDLIGALLNSAFTTSLVGALAGAFAGARAAQRVAERAKEREQLVVQIRAINGALTATFVLCNLLISLKKQHLKPLHDNFVSKKAELEVFQRMRRAGQIPKDQPFEFTADLHTLQMPLLPVDVVQRLIFDKLSLHGRPLALIASLAGVAASLTKLMENRARLVHQFKEVSENEPSIVPALYFGHEFAPGRTSTEHADNLRALYDQTDDGIFFSQLLCKDLAEAGDKALAKYKKLEPKTLERISSIDFTAARDAGLIPDDAKYGDWLKGFQPLNR